MPRTKELLNKSRHASCLHIFRWIARKFLEIHQVFLRRFHAITGGGFRLRKICLRNLHTRFNQCFLKMHGIRFLFGTFYILSRFFRTNKDITPSAWSQKSA